MKAFISKSRISGKVTAPSSKSYTIRGVLCAALAKGESEIVRPLTSDDTEASLDVLNKIGIRARQQPDTWHLSGGNFKAPTTDLYCRESALTLRFMTAISALVPGECRLTMAPSLARRPITPLVDALKQLGVNCHNDEKKAIVTVKGGKLNGGITELPGNISSQFVSALLLISPFAENGMKIRLTTSLESLPFVQMTLECLELFGVKVKASKDFREFETVKQAYKPTRYMVEGDWTSASYPLALGALCGEVETGNLNPASLQGDKIMLDYLKDMGAEVVIGNKAVMVKQSRLKAIKADLTNCIDLLPTLAVVAAVAEGVSEFTGIQRARFKESDRVAAVSEGLQRVGIQVGEEKNKLSITGSVPKGAIIDSKGDHRIAMAFSLLGLLVGDVTIDGAECVAKTYPEYWDIIRSLGGKVKLDGE